MSAYMCLSTVFPCIFWSQSFKASIHMHFQPFNFFSPVWIAPIASCMLIPSLWPFCHLHACSLEQVPHTQNTSGNYRNVKYLCNDVIPFDICYTLYSLLSPMHISDVLLVFTFPLTFSVSLLTKQ